MCALRQARILSSETDNTIKQEQNTNVNIKITPPNKNRNESAPPFYGQSPEVSMRPYPTVQPTNPNVNFTQANQPVDIPTGLAQRDTSQVGQTLGSTNPGAMPLGSQMTANKEPVVPDFMSIAPGQSPTNLGTFQYQPPINRGFEESRANNGFPSQERGNGFAIERERITDLTNEIDELDKKNKFSEMLVAMYESNPLKINSYVVCESKLLMNMIKLLTDCEKVDLVLDDNITCGGCTTLRVSGSKSRIAKSSKIIYVSKILVSKDGQTEEFKYKYNRIYTEFIKYGISLKMTY